MKLFRCSHHCLIVKLFLVKALGAIQCLLRGKAEQPVCHALQSRQVEEGRGDFSVFSFRSSEMTSAVPAFRQAAMNASTLSF